MKFDEKSFLLVFRLLTDIQRHLKVGNRTAAMKLLRKKKLIEREYDKKESTVDHLNTVLTKIEQTDYSSLVILFFVNKMIDIHR